MEVPISLCISAPVAGAKTAKLSDMYRALCAIGLAAILTGGCKAYVEEEAGRTAGEVIDDTVISARVKARLIGDKELSGFRIRVDVDKGVVRLRGKIERPELRPRALELVRGVRGVVDVVDQLELVEPEKEDPLEEDSKTPS